MLILIPMKVYFPKSARSAEEQKTQSY